MTARLDPSHRRRSASRPLPLLAVLALAASTVQAAPWIPDHVVMVIEENKAYENIIGYVNAPYINSLAQNGASMTQSYAIDGHSQPNYLQLFAGSNQGVTDNSTPHGFSTPNLRSALAAAGYSFTGYSESMPYAGYTGDSYTSVAGQAQYVRKHNPWINWIGAPANAVPTSEALPFTAFPTDYSTLPDFSIVIPNEQHNMHDGGRSAGDAWLQANLSGYIAWAQTHNSLFVLTFDEDDGSHAGHITTIFVGPMVIAGQYSQTIDHLNVLRTLTDLYGLAPLGDAAGVAPIAGIFAVPEPATALLLLPGLAWLGAGWPGQRRSAPNGAA